RIPDRKSKITDKNLYQFQRISDYSYIFLASIGQINKGFCLINTSNNHKNNRYETIKQTFDP
ncbi:MAG: hypothetical protein K8R53_14285, partial [Bacteroidales bacterium]|nr:hypothetical protein [Bacteroidales bacterium]